MSAFKRDKKEEEDGVGEPAQEHRRAHQAALHAEPGGAAEPQRGDRRVLRHDQAVPVARSGAAPPGLHGDQGAEHHGGGCDHRHLQPHQGHDWEGGHVPGGGDSGPVQHNRGRNAAVDRALHEAGHRGPQPGRELRRPDQRHAHDVVRRGGRQAMGERGPGGGAQRQHYGPIPRPRPAVSHPARRPIGSQQAGGAPDTPLLEIPLCRLHADPHRRPTHRGRGRRQRLAPLSVHRGLFPAQIGNGGVRGGSRRRQPGAHHQPRAGAGRVGAAAVLRRPQGHAALRRCAHPEPGGNRASGRRHRLQSGPGEPDHRLQSVDCHAGHHHAAQNRGGVLGGPPDEADRNLCVGDQRRVQGGGGAGDPRPRPEVPAQAQQPDELPVGDVARRGRAGVQGLHRRHHHHDHRGQPGGEGDRAGAPVRVHRGLRAHLPGRAHPQSAGQGGPAHQTALALHPLHLQPRVFRGGVDVLVRAKLALADGVTMQLTVRSQDEGVAELITSAVG
ncbi:hypothetical protein YQE_10166, partial [Dendroctonus ponderosae]